MDGKGVDIEGGVGLDDVGLGIGIGVGIVVNGCGGTVN